MNFLNPFILFGLIAASIPIILHFLNLRRVKKVEFSTLKFLKELQKSQIRKVKLRQLLLLFLRTMLIIFIVLAFARPIINGTLPGFSKYAKTSSIIIIDNSPSMNLSDEYGNRFNFAKRIAKKLLDQIHPGDEVIILQMSNLQNNEFRFSSDIKALTEQINSMHIGFTVPNMSKILELAYSFFDNAKNFNKEIYIITDNQEINYRNFNVSKIEKYKPSFYFMTIGSNSGNKVSNLSIDSINFVTRIFQKNNPIQIQAFIRNHSMTLNKNSSISEFFSDEKVAQSSFNINKNSVKAIDLSANIRSNQIINGKIQLENDALNEDNTRYFGILLPNKPKIAYITSEKNPFILSALFYNMNESYCQTDILSVSDFNTKNIDKYNSLIIDSYNNLSFEKLYNYIINSGKVLLIPSQDIMNYSNLLYKFFNSTIEYKNNHTTIISNINKNHPLFDGVFLDKTSSNNPDNIKINQIATVNGGIPIIETNFGNLLSEFQIQNGKIIYLSVIPNTSWGNLPTSSLFPIIMYRSILYLSMLPELSKSFNIGENVQIIIPEKLTQGTNFKIIDPKNNESFIYAPLLPSGLILTLKNLEYPGNYVIYDINNNPIAIASGNISKDESNLKPIINDKITSLLTKKFGKHVHIAYIDEFSSLRKKIEKVRTGTELWQFLIILAIITAILEMIVQRITKHEIVD